MRHSKMGNQRTQLPEPNSTSLMQAAPVPSRLAYLRLLGPGVGDVIPVIAIQAVGNFELAHECPGFHCCAAVPSSGALDDDAFHHLGCTQVHLQPLFAWLRLRDPREPARAAADQASGAGAPEVLPGGGGGDLGIGNEA